MEYFKHDTDQEVEKVRLPQRLENYKVRYQEIVPCGFCGQMTDIHDMARGENVLTRDSWFCSPDCEKSYLQDEETYNDLDFSEVDEMDYEDYADFLSGEIDRAKDQSEADNQ